MKKTIIGMVGVAIAVVFMAAAAKNSVRRAVNPQAAGGNPMLFAAVR